MAPPDRGQGAAVECTIDALDVDDAGKEVNLVAGTTLKRPRTLAQLLAELRELPVRCLDYDLYSSAPWHHVGKGVELREDALIVNCVVDDDGRRVGFVGTGARLDA